MSLALDALRRHDHTLNPSNATLGTGQEFTVVRLKQGDPFIYGRGGEEILFFRRHGYEPLLIPGLSSSLAAPLSAGIPVTQRGVSDSLVLCTGVGRKGNKTVMPGYKRSRTLVVLMGVARVAELVETLCSPFASVRVAKKREQRKMSEATEGKKVIEGGTYRDGRAYPRYLPVALIERGTCPDQRVLLTTLGALESSISKIGDGRPPGMMVIGWSCFAMEGKIGNIDILDDEGRDFEDAAFVHSSCVTRLEKSIHPMQLTQHTPLTELRHPSEGEEEEEEEEEEIEAEEKERTIKREELEKKDRERCFKVLGECGYLVREGISESWKTYLDQASQSF